jgi:hypothetical protein
MMQSKKNFRRVWEPHEDKQLREMVEAGKSLTLIIARLDRTKMAVQRRLQALKIQLRDRKKNPPGVNRRA